MSESAEGATSGGRPTPDRQALRRAARAARSALTPAARARAVRSVSRHLERHLRIAGLLAPGKRIAAFIAVHDEIGVGPLLARLLGEGRTVWLPRITDRRARRMTFSQLGPRWRLNRYGIPEPAGVDRCAARWLHVVLVPLVGFDRDGNRLGSGAGYYDRALAHRRRHARWRAPRLIGVAHSCQQLPSSPPSPTDVPLDAVVTENGFFPLPGAPR